MAEDEHPPWQVEIMQWTESWRAAMDESIRLRGELEEQLQQSNAHAVALDAVAREPDHRSLGKME